jgi:RNA polymerase sigma factor (sigma-70 family)
MPNITALVRRCQAGDLEAFSTLFRAYQQRIYSLAVAILKDETAADDIVQETFLAVFVKISSYNSASSFETWLIAIAVNRCRDRMRRDKVRQALSLEKLTPGLLSHLWGRSPDPAGIVEKQQRQDTLWNLVDQLDDRLRLPLMLCYRYAYSAQEAAQILGTNSNRVYQQLYEGRQKLRLLVETGGEKLERGWDADDADDADFLLYQRPNSRRQI